jgi:hypothetical protein
MTSEFSPSLITARGWCARCGCEHQLGTGAALNPARELMEELTKRQTIAPNSAFDAKKNPWSTAPLFAEARGQMFGMLEGENSQGRSVILKAFSGQFNGVWLADGWAPPLFNVDDFHRIMDPADDLIKDLGRQMEGLASDSEERLELRTQRKEVSRQVMKDLHGLYRLRNARGEEAPLTDFFTDRLGPPTGAGDCCAPKLLNQALALRVRPRGLVEFFWGRASKSGTKQHGRFYASCDSKCAPILGFMLCGVAS